MATITSTSTATTPRRAPRFEECTRLTSRRTRCDVIFAFMSAGESSSNSPGTRQDATAIVRRLREAGHVAYFAGGCVRDMLLEHEPKDFDVATDAPPDRVRKLFSSTQAVGAAFGVILVRHG